MEKYITQTSNDVVLLNQQTGEVHKFKQVRKVSLDEYIMVFFTGYAQMFKLGGTQLKVLMCCWKFSDFSNNKESGNVMHNNATFKEQCRLEGLDIPDASIDNSISALSKKGLLLKKCRGEYVLNPHYFFRGKLSNRSKLELTFATDPTIGEENESAD